LYADEMERPLPIGLGRDGAPVHVDLDFFDGRKGGHMSISGISGVATKTSFALFFLRMLTSTPEVVGSGAANLRVLVFNVKGEDLLWLDRPNASFEAHEGAREGWTALGVDPAPFPSVRFWAPPRRQSGDVVVPDTGGRFEGVEVFSWTPRAFIDQDLLEFCFTDASDAKNQIPFIRERVQLQLKRWAVGVDGMPGAVALRDPAQAPDGHAWSRDDRIPAAQADVVITDLPSLVRALEVHLEPGDGSEADAGWTARVMPGTVAAFLRRLHAASARLGHLVRADADRRIDRGAANVTVIAIQSLHEQAQRFVVGALLRETFKEKEDTGQRLPLSVIVLDELNKYAPREGTGPLKDMLIDIAQRGRSLGVLLVGAQQTASRVAPEVLENAAIRVTGRLDSAEAERAEYGWMLPSTRARARLLKPGTMVVSQPAIPVPLVVTFPFPPWATRKEEVADAGDDPFAGLT
jgi:DNA helicase HerA-like ATPase